MTTWEFCYLKLNDFNELLSLELLGRGELPFGPWFDLQRFEGIEIVFLAVPSGPEGAEHICAMLKENKTLTTLVCAPPARACAHAASRAPALAFRRVAAAAVRRTH